jgi:hypothetical protein
MDRFCNNDLEPSRAGICYMDRDQSYAQGAPASRMVQGHISRLSSHPESNISIYSLTGFPGLKSGIQCLLKHNGNHICLKWFPSCIPLTVVDRRAKLQLFWLTYWKRVSPPLSARFLSCPTLADLSILKPFNSSLFLTHFSLRIRGSKPGPFSSYPCGSLVPVPTPVQGLLSLA